MNSWQCRRSGPGSESVLEARHLDREFGVENGYLEKKFFPSNQNAEADAVEGDTGDGRDMNASPSNLRTQKRSSSIQCQEGEAVLSGTVTTKQLNADGTEGKACDNNDKGPPRYTTPLHTLITQDRVVH